MFLGYFQKKLNNILINYFVNDNYEHIIFKCMHLTNKYFFHIKFSQPLNIFMTFLLFGQTWFWNQTMCFSYIIVSFMIWLSHVILTKILKSWMSPLSVLFNSDLYMLFHLGQELLSVYVCIYFVDTKCNMKL
jgi:hypothetical protein